MGQKDPRVDEYIARSGGFAKPILKRLRAAIHRGCPAVAEDLKWNAPFFVYKGILCMMAAFKRHCTFGFWKHGLLKKRVKKFLPVSSRMMKGLFDRLDSPADLPDERTLVRLVQEACILNELDLKTPRKASPAQKRPLAVPTFFLRAVRANKKAWEAYKSGSYTFKKEYVEWVKEAKSDATRERRLRTAVAWMAHGKSRNWKYEK